MYILILSLHRLEDNEESGGRGRSPQFFFLFFLEAYMFYVCIVLVQVNTVQYKYIQPSLPGPFLVHTLLCVKIIALQKRSENKSLPGVFFFQTLTKLIFKKFKRIKIISKGRTKRLLLIMSRFTFFLGGGRGRGGVALQYVHTYG